MIICNWRKRAAYPQDRQYSTWTSESQLWGSITQIKGEGPCPIFIYPNWQIIKKRNLNRDHWSHFCFVSATKPGSCLYTDGWTKLVTRVVSWSRVHLELSQSFLSCNPLMIPPIHPLQESPYAPSCPPKNYPMFWVSSGISPSKSRIAAQDHGAGKIEEMTRMRIVHGDWRCTFLLCLHDIDNHM